MQTLIRHFAIVALLLTLGLVGCQQIDPVEAYMDIVDQELVEFDKALETGLGLGPDDAAEVLDSLLVARDRVADLDVPDGAQSFANATLEYMDLVIRMLDEIMLESCDGCAREYGAQAGAQRGILDRDRLQPQGGH